MIDSRTQERLVSEFIASQGMYSDLVSVLESLVSRLILDERYVVHSVTSRCKNKESLARKLALPGKSYESLTDITDIAGLRITTYFSDDVDAIAKILSSEFCVDSTNSVDKRQTQDPDRFGYQSLHFVASFAPSRTDLREYRRFFGMKFEIQIRSILQHAWAEIEHDLGYKSAIDVPREVRRRFARVAGLLELADAEFSAIRHDLASYGEALQTQIKISDTPIELNLPSLRALYRSKSSLQALDAVIAQSADSVIIGDDSSLDGSELPWLKRLNICTIGDLEAAAHKLGKELNLFADFWLEGRKHKELTRGIGLFYLTFLLLSKTHNKSLISEYCIDSKFGNPEGTAERLFEYSKNGMT